MRLVRFPVTIFSVLVILFGFYQLNNEHEIFAQSEAYCCNNGHCTYPNVLCSASSSVQITDDRCKNDYIVTCKTCVDYSYDGTACYNPVNSCKDQNNDCYGWCYVNGNWIWVVDEVSQ